MKMNAIDIGHRVEFLFNLYVHFLPGIILKKILNLNGTNGFSKI